MYTELLWQSLKRLIEVATSQDQLDLVRDMIWEAYDHDQLTDLGLGTLLNTLNTKEESL